ncbi:hypothetical protein [Streptococcus mitis]|nr:hypothetical protein [Streptococcus mitis]
MKGLIRCPLPDNPDLFEDQSDSSLDIVDKKTGDLLTRRFYDLDEEKLLGGKDMTYEFFKELLSYGEEFVIYFQDKKFYIGQRKDLGEIYFTVSEKDYQVFHNQTEFLSAALINGKTLGEAWDELEVY